jgi:hypothetical protein
MERDQRLTELAMELDAARPHMDKIAKEKAQAVAENSALKTYAATLFRARHEL